MDITKKHSTEIYKDEQHGRHHQKHIKMSNMDITKIHNTEIYKDEQYGRHHQKYIKMSNMPVPSQGHYGFHSFPVVD